MRNRILIVDDDPTTAYLILHVLKGEGHRVHWESNPKQGLSFAEVHAPRLIFCDIEMREMNGLELAARLHLSGHRMPLWLMSGSNRFATQVESAVASGHARGFLEKPVEFQTLRDIAR